MHRLGRAQRTREIWAFLWLGVMAGGLLATSAPHGTGSNNQVSGSHMGPITNLSDQRPEARFAISVGLAGAATREQSPQLRMSLEVNARHSEVNGSPGTAGQGGQGGAGATGGAGITPWISATLTDVTRTEFLSSPKFLSDWRDSAFTDFASDQATFELVLRRNPTGDRDSDSEVEWSMDVEVGPVTAGDATGDEPALEIVVMPL